ncbi:MAG: ParB/RepB/Spo0J family partition protein [Oscillospiraceae bacterium]
MANNPKGLGKGLAALLGDDVIDSQEKKSSLFLPISQVESCASQPRKQFDPESLADLADSIREHGIIQPLTVRKLQSGYYQIIAGERRWRAARMAGLTQVPAIIIEADDRKAMELAMIENLQREDLNPIEEAEGYQVLMSQYNMTQEETAQRVGKSRSAVANALRLLNLCPPVRAMVEDGRLTNGHARALLPLSPALQETAAASILKNDLSVRQTEVLVKKLTAEKRRSPPHRRHRRLCSGGRPRSGKFPGARLSDRHWAEKGPHRTGVLQRGRPQRPVGGPPYHQKEITVSRETRKGALPCLISNLSGTTRKPSRRISARNFRTPSSPW